MAAPVTPAGLLADFDVTTGGPGSFDRLWAEDATPTTGSLGTVRVGTSTSNGVRFTMVSGDLLAIDSLNWSTAANVRAPQIGETGDTDPSGRHWDDFDEQTVGLSFYIWHRSVLYEFAASDGNLTDNVQFFNWHQTGRPATWVSGDVMRLLFANAGQSTVVSNFVQGFGVPDIPDDPTLATQTDGDIRVTWTAPTDFGNTAITSYTVRWRESGTSDTYSTHTTSDGTTLTYDIPVAGLTTGTTYEVGVQATNAVGASGYQATQPTIAYTFVADAMPTFGSTTVADQSATIGEMFSVTLPEATGGDAPLTYSVTNAPTWAGFVAATRVLSGTPPAQDAETTTVTYTVTDDDGDEDSLMFDIVESQAAPDGLEVDFQVDLDVRSNSDRIYQRAGVRGTFVSGDAELDMGGTTATVGTVWWNYDETPPDIRPGIGDRANDTPWANALTHLAGKAVYFWIDDDLLNLHVSDAGVDGENRLGWEYMTRPGTVTTGDRLRVLIADEDSAYQVRAYITGNQRTSPLSLSGLVVSQTGIVNTAFSYTLPAATGGRVPHTYSATGLPTWATFSSTARTITGTPDAAGTTTVTYTVTDGDMDRVVEEFDITIAADLTPAFDSEPVNQTGRVGDAFTYTLPAASGGNTPITYSVTNEPSWASFNAGTRVLSGNPDAAATTTVTYTVTDTDGDEDTANFDIVISPADSMPTLADIDDQSGTYNTAYSFTLPEATGGDAPLTYTLTNLPSWASFDDTTRVLSGTPDDAATTTLTYTVTDNDLDTASVMFDLTIAAVVPFTPSILTTTLLSDNSIRVTWSLPDDGGSAITRYGVRWREDGTSDTYSTHATADASSRTYDIPGSGLSRSTTYEIGVVAVNSVGEGSYQVTQPTIMTGDVPGRPGDFRTTSVTHNAITVTWEAPDANLHAITGYTAHIQEDGQPSGMMASTNVRGHTWTGLDSNTRYGLWATATNSLGTGLQSTPTLFVTTTTIVPTFPGAAGVTLTAGNSHVVVDWTPPASDGNSAITGYIVEYRRGTSGNWTQVMLGATARTQTIKPLENGQVHQARVGTTNSVGTTYSAFADFTPSATGNLDFEDTLFTTGTNEVARFVFTIGDFGAPADDEEHEWLDLRSDPQVGSVTGDNSLPPAIGRISWNNNDTRGHFTLNRETGETASLDGWFNVNEPKTWYWLNSADTDTSTDLKGVDVHAGGGDDWKRWEIGAGTDRDTFDSWAAGDRVLVVVADNDTVDLVELPNAPTSLSITEGNDELTVSWTASSDNGGRSITNYYVQTSTDGTTYSQHDAGTSTSHTVTGLTGGQEYHVRVKARTSLGWGAASAVSMATPTSDEPPVAPTVPPLLAAGVNSIIVERLTATTRSDPALGVDIRYRVDGTSNWTTVSTTDSTYTIANLTPGTSYNVQYATKNAHGTSGFSPSSTATVRHAAPSTPISTSLTSSYRTITWVWEAGPGGGTVTGFRITWDGGGGDSGTHNTNASATTYTITGLNHNTVYTVSLSALGPGGQSGFVSAQVNTLEEIDPEEIDDLAVTPGDSSLTLNWTEPELNTGTLSLYRVEYRPGTSGTWTQLTTLNPTNYHIGSLVNGQSYQVRVRAETTHGNGPWQDPPLTGTPATPQPSAPQNLQASVDFQDVTLTWDAPLSMGTANIIDYQVQYQGTGLAQVEQTVTVRTLELMDLSAGVSYQARVRARNTHGYGPYTGFITFTPVADPEVPDRITSVNTTVGSGTVSFTWSAPDDNRATITEYHLERKLTSEGAAAWGNRRVYLLPSASVGGLVNGTSYDFRIRAVNSVGNADWSPTFMATPVGIPGVPQPVLTVSMRTITATWPAPSDGGGTISEYQARISTDDTTWAEETTGTNLTVTFHALIPGQQYYVGVRAQNENGWSAWTSPSVTATIAAEVPDRMETPLVTSGIRSLIVGWVAPNANGSPITQFEIQYSTNQAQWTQINITNTSLVAHTIPNLQNGILYYVRIRAQNSVGDGDWSTVVSRQTAAQPSQPAAPTVLPRAEALLVQWVAPFNGGHNITEYTVRWREDGTAGAWSDHSLNALTYLIPNLMHGVDYEVQVAATNAVGISLYSDSSVAAPLRGASLPARPALPPSLISEDTEITATWSPPYDGGTPIVDYNLRYRIGTGSWTDVTVATPPETVTGLVNGTVYEFQYRARNSVGDGPYSASAYGIPSVHVADTLVSFGMFSFAANERTDLSLDHINQRNMDDNFAEVVPIMTRLPNTDGAFDEYGTGVAPQAPGSVRASFWIVARHPSFMRQMRSAFARMAAYGLTTLTKHALDGQSVTCQARIRRITWPRETSQAAHRQLLASIEWAVPSPGWLSPTITNVDHNDVSDGDTLIVSVTGEKHVRPRIRLTRAGSTNITEAVIQRTVGGEVIDEITYSGTIDNNDTVWIDCGARTVEENGTDSFANFDADSGSWLLLDPNVANTLVVDLTPAVAQVDIRIEYRAGYYN